MTLISYYHRDTCPYNFTRAEINCLTSHSFFQKLLTIRPPCKTRELSTECMCVRERARWRLEQPVLMLLRTKCSLHGLRSAIKAPPSSTWLHLRLIFCLSLFLLFLCSLLSLLLPVYCVLSSSFWLCNFLLSYFLQQMYRIYFLVCFFAGVTSWT